ncbi:d-importin 7/ranbp7 [Anaeramoeba flamelloides]|uniref:D-importin 7/ranbp7 n=1 Tax=Anaeramoeba flamelloides TaxID=1746091 RepID=A0ABQ8XAH3_9EUKA|nr:d-importin 7/ranbp7 [Anaeramoeba flamelloides]
MEQLAEIFTNTLSPYREVQIKAEELLEKYSEEEGFFPSLLEFCLIENYQLGIRQASSIYFKHGIKELWTQKGSISEQDRKIILENIFITLTKTPKLIQSQLGEAFYHLVLHNFPKRMKNTFEQTLEYAQSKNPEECYAGLFALRKICLKYEMAISLDRKIYIPILEQSFPILLDMCEQFVEAEKELHNEIKFKNYNQNNLQEEYEEKQNQRKILILLIKTIFKIFLSAIKMLFPKFLMVTDVFKRWIILFCTLLIKNFDFENEKEEEEEEEEEEIHKLIVSCKKWSMQIILRFFEKFNSPQLVKKKFKNFADIFLNNFSKELIDILLNILEIRSKKNKYVSERVLQLIIATLHTCLFFSKTYLLMKPKIELILIDTIFPILCTNSKDQELLEEDPHEFIRIEFMGDEATFLPKIAAQNFLLDLCTARAKGNLEGFIQYLGQIFEEYSNTPNDVDLILKKDGAMKALGILAPKLKTLPDFFEDLELILKNYILPEFNSKYWFLKARACWLFGNYANLPFQEEDIKLLALKNVVDCLIYNIDENQNNNNNEEEKEDEITQQQYIVIKLFAAISLKPLVLTIDNIAKIIDPVITDVIKDLILLISQIGVPEIVSTAHTLIERFGNKIDKYAEELCETFCNSFVTSLENEKEGIISNNLLLQETVVHVADQSLQTIVTLIDALQNEKGILFKLQRIVLPILLQTINEGNHDFLESLLEIAISLTYYSKKINPDFLKIIVNLHEAYTNYAPDSISSITMVLDNLITQCPTFVIENENGKYLELIIDLAKFAISDLRTPVEEIIEACQLLESVIQNLNGLIDPIIPLLLEIVLNRIDTEEKYNSIIIACYGLIGNLLLYNPLITVNYLEENKISDQIFENYYSLIVNKKFKSFHNKKVSILGLSSLFLITKNDLSEGLLKLLPSMFNCILLLIDMSSEQKFQREQLQKKKKLLLDKNENSEQDYVNENDLNQEFELKELSRELNDNEDGINNEDISRLKTLLNKIHVAGGDVLETPLEYQDSEEDEDEVEDEDEEFGNNNNKNNVKLLQQYNSESSDSYDGSEENFDYDSENEDYVDEKIDFTCPIDSIEEIEFFINNCKKNIELMQYIEKNLEQDTIDAWETLLSQQKQEN